MNCDKENRLACRPFFKWLLLGGVLAWPAEGLYAAEPPLPTVAELLERISESAARESSNNAAFKHTYRFVKSRYMEFRDGDGDIIKQESRVSTNYPALSRASAVSANAPSSKAKTRGLSIKNITLTAELFDRFDCSLSGREVVNARPMLVLDFQPKPDKLPERDFSDRIINCCAGRAWVDESDGVVARADLHLTAPVTVMGGMLGMIRTFTYIMSRERTSDGLWFVRKANWQVEGREVCFRRTVCGYEERNDVVRAN